MLNRQIDYVISKYGMLAKFAAAVFLHCSMGEARLGLADRFSSPFSNRTNASFHDSP
jgi:hypothetical protein